MYECVWNLNGSKDEKERSHVLKVRGEKKETKSWYATKPDEGFEFAEDWSRTIGHECSTVTGEMTVYSFQMSETELPTID